MDMNSTSCGPIENSGDSIDSGSKPVSIWDRVNWDALTRLRARFLDETLGGDNYWHTEEELESYDLTFGQRIAWKWVHVMDELSLLGWTPPQGPILDWGCGSGVAGRVVARKWFPQHGSLLYWDRSVLAAHYAKLQAKERLEGVNVEIAPNFESDQNGLLLFSHVLTELEPSQMEQAIQVASKASAVICVEPGNFGASRRLIHFREAMLDRFNVIAPCSHRFRCPMLDESNSRDWCHFFASPPGEAFTDSGWNRFSTFMGIDLRALPVSYLVLDRRSNSASSLQGLSRVLGRPKIFKPYALLNTCSESGLEFKQVSRRSEPEVYKSLKKGDTPGWLRL